MMYRILMVGAFLGLFGPGCQNSEETEDKVEKKNIVSLGEVFRLRYAKSAVVQGENLGVKLESTEGVIPCNKDEVCWSATQPIVNVGILASQGSDEQLLHFEQSSDYRNYIPAQPFKDYVVSLVELDIGATVTSVTKFDFEAAFRVERKSEPTKANLGKAFPLSSLNDVEIETEGIVVSLKGIDDARCPCGLSCLLGGEAIIAVELTTIDASKTVQLLEYGAPSTTVVFSSQEYILSLSKLEPQCLDHSKPSSYLVNLSISKKDN